MCKESRQKIFEHIDKAFQVGPILGVFMQNRAQVIKKIVACQLLLRNM
jgi:hypothetical protein